MRMKYTALPLVMTLALVACGGGKSDTPAAATGETAEVAAAKPTGDPCRFLTAAEMTAITTDGVSELIREDNSCTYRSKPEDGPRVAITIGGADKAMETARRAAGLMAGMGDAVADKSAAGADTNAILKQSGADAPKVGDEALWGPVGILYARKGDAYVEVYPPNIHDPANHKGYPVVLLPEKKRIAQAIATKILAKAAP